MVRHHTAARLSDQFERFLHRNRRRFERAFAEYHRFLHRNRRRFERAFAEYHGPARDQDQLVMLDRCYGSLLRLYTAGISLGVLHVYFPTIVRLCADTKRLDAFLTSLEQVRGKAVRSRPRRSPQRVDRSIGVYSSLRCMVADGARLRAGSGIRQEDRP